MATVSLLGELRAGTREDHERLEGRLDVMARCHQREGYSSLLAGFCSVYRPLEHAVTTSRAGGHAVPDWPARIKSPWLEQDLADLGVPAPPAADVPDLVGAEDVVGAVYVMEGATLGGALIERELARMPAPPPHRFFTGYGRRRGAMWRAFGGHVAALDADGLDRDLAVAAARRTFRAMEQACLPEEP